ncbi:hypothetical protein [Pontimicrobium sp. IMCC45349]|uniref:hypothetical protein n=1 Tax=Pontimicrobium sp. IMCC45349 TaxID=3391574 RepID=UPI0039A3E69F
MKQQDIRDVFKDEEKQNHNMLPKHHRDEFIAKLKAQNTKKQKQFFRINYKYAAILIIGFLFGSLFFLKSELDNKETVLELQLKQIEQEYLSQIDIEWQQFTKYTKDKRLVERYQLKLTDLDKTYKEILSEFQKDKNNILVLESLISNLKLRLQILKDIQQHIKLLNQKSEQNEIII